MSLHRPKTLGNLTCIAGVRRRTLLAVAGASLAGMAGCSSRSDDGGGLTERTTDGTPTDSPADTPTATSTPFTEDLPTFDADEVQRQVSPASVDDVPDEHPVAIDVELRNGTVTADDPARVRATVTNTAGGERRITRNDGGCALFDRFGGASETPGLHLHRPDFPGFALDCSDPPRRGNLWRFDLADDATCAVQEYGCSRRAYDAGESQPETYQVWDDYAAPGYMPPGTYRFATEVTVGPPEAGEAFEWGFSLAVERPA